MAPRLKHPLRYRVEAAGARALFAFLDRLSIPAASSLGGWMGRTLGPLSGAHLTATRNLARSLPELDTAARERILRRAWDNFGRTMVEYAVLRRLTGEAERARIVLTGHEPLAALAAAGKPAILMCAHLGNWEVIPIATARVGAPLVIVYRPPNNPLVEDIIRPIRESYTLATAPKGSAGARQVLTALRQGRHVAMVVDQKINTGLEVPFFGRGAFTGPGIVRFAAHTGCPVFPVRTERVGDCDFRVDIEAPWTFERAEDEYAALARVNRRIEDWVRAQPGQWLWMHRRWPA